MTAFPHKYRTILLSALLCLLPAAVFGAGQQPGEDGPPLQDESALPDSEVPALKHDITEPFIKPARRRSWTTGCRPRTRWTSSTAKT